jgi:hypothetical protein
MNARFSLLSLALLAAAIASGCVARVETDPAPASGTVDVDVDPPQRGPDVNVKVD